MDAVRFLDVVFENDQKGTELRLLYGLQVLVIFCLFVVGITFLPLVLYSIVPPTSELFLNVREQSSPTHIVVILFAFIQFPVFLLSRHYLKVNKKREFRVVYWIQALVSQAWCALFLFYCLPFYYILSLVVFLGLYAGWSFNDGELFLGAVEVRAQYVASIVLADIILLAFDLFGGFGIIAAFQADWMFVAEFLGAQIVALVMSILVQMFVGTKAKSLLLIQEGGKKLKNEMTILKTEREVIQRCCVFLSKGLTASKFSHDVASPATALKICVEELREMLNSEEYEIPEKERETLNAMLLDMSGATDEILRMTKLLAQSVRKPETPTKSEIDSFVERGLGAMLLNLEVHGVRKVEREVVLEQAQVWVTSGHDSMLGNVLANAVLQNPQGPIEVRGRKGSDLYYHLTIRDHGVAPGQRGDAVRRVLDSLSLESRHSNAPADEESGQQYKGYGLGLLMARILVLQHGGWIDVTEPEDGDGLVVHLVLPRKDPKDIDLNQAYPEKLVTEGFVRRQS